MAKNIENIETIITVIVNNLDALDDLADKLERLDNYRLDREYRFGVDIDDVALDRLLDRLERGGTLDFDGRRGGVATTSLIDIDAVEPIADMFAGRLGDRLESALRELTVNLDVDDAAENISEMSESAWRASRRFDILNPSMSDMHNALAKVIPLLVTMILALPALLTGLIALGVAALAAAGALATIGALGFLAIASMGGGKPSMERMQEVMLDIIDAIWRGIEPVVRRFEGFGGQMLDGIERFVVQFAQTVGPSLVALTDDARNFGRWFTEYIPNAFRNLSAMAEAFAPVFAEIADWLMDTSITRALTAVFYDMIGSLRVLSALIVDMLPGFIALSVGFLEATNIALILLNALGNLAEMIGLDAEVIGLLVGSALVLITTLSVLSAVMNIIAATSGTTLVGGLYSAGLSMITASGAAKTLAASLINVGFSARLATIAIGTLLAVTGIGLLVVAVGWLASEWMKVGTNVNEAADAMERFDRISGGPSAYGNIYEPDRNPRLQPVESTQMNFYGGTPTGDDADSMRNTLQWRGSTRYR